MKYANDNAVAGATADPITFISMFSGIEAASVAFAPLGWKAVAFAEIEKFPSAVLAHHYPDVPNVGDMTAHDWSQYRHKVDIVCGGPPCQAFSVAGLRNSMQDARGNLSLSYMRALHAIDPRNAIVENVPGWLNTPDNAFGCFLAGIVGADDALLPSPKPDAGKSDAHWKWSKKRGSHTLSWPIAGMVSGPQGRAAWRIQDAQFHGLAQRRRRVLLVADFGRGADPAAVLFELLGVSGDTPPSRETGKDVAPTISARTKGGGGLGTDFDLDGGLIEAQAWAIQERAVSLNLDAGPQGKGYQPEVAYTLEARNKVQSVAFAPEIARCVATREGSSQDYETTTMVAVGVTGDIAHTLKAEGADASEDGTGRGTSIIAYDHSLARDAVALVNGELVARPTLKADHGRGLSDQMPHVLTSAVRRLTPTECERLQGFPDGYTDIPWRGKPTSPDGPRYKALGNSWAVPKFTWLCRRIAMHMPARSFLSTTRSEAA